jgi:hypothetical protein
MGGGSNFAPITRKVAPYMAKLANPLMHFAKEEDQLLFSDPLNLTGVNTPEIETLPAPSKTNTTVTDLEAEASKASQAEADRLKKRKGYKETVLTSVSGSLDSPTTLKQTLGGT